MSANNIVPATISVIPKLPIKGIYYIGQYGTSGYASAARGYLYHYFTNGLPITWDALYFDNSKLSDDDLYDIVIRSLIKKTISFHDMVIMHSTPDLWPKFWKDKAQILNNKIVTGYCTWETNKLPAAWVKCINDCVGEVWCPSSYNEQTFKASGVTKTIRVVPHIFLPYTLPLKSDVKIIDNISNEIIADDSLYTFYTIGEFNARKGIDDAIQSFCESFTSKDPVRFIIKVHYKDYSQDNKKKCLEMINTILNKYPNHAKVICLLDNISNKEILALHSIGDCYVSLTKSEGFGLTIFDAFNYGKKIITTGYSGHIDFLKTDYPGLVGYKIGPVTGMSSFSTHYTEDQQWAYPDIGHAKELMKSISNI